MAKEIIKEDLEKIHNLVETLFNNEKISEIKRLGGLTNHTYMVQLENNEKIVVRLPGDGTEEMINRKDEKVSTELACKLKIDTDLLYFGDDGTKITKYIDNTETMNAKKLKAEDKIIMVSNIFKTLHNSGVDTKIPFEVFEMARQYENIINTHNISQYEDYDEIKNIVKKIKNIVESNENIIPVTCHNDPICENWIVSNGKMFLIDYEYAGMNDAMWDLADVSIEADYNDEQDMIMLKNYFGETPTKIQLQRFYANKIYTDYLWFLWGKARAPFDGQSMEDYAFNRYVRLKENIEKLKVYFL